MKSLLIIILPLVMFIDTFAYAGENLTGSTLCAQLESTFGDIPETTIKNIGFPNNKTITEIQNKHDKNQIDEDIIYNFSGGYVEWYNVPKYKKSFLWTVLLTKSFWPNHLPSLIGLNTIQISDNLGKADEIEPSKLIYYCDNESILVFKIEAGIVTAVTYHGDID